MLGCVGKCITFEHMDSVTYSAKLSMRLPESMALGVERLANKRKVKPAEVYREAIKNFLEAEARKQKRRARK